MKRRAGGDHVDAVFQSDLESVPIWSYLSMASCLALELCCRLESTRDIGFSRIVSCIQFLTLSRIDGLICP